MTNPVINDGTTLPLSELIDTRHLATLTNKANQLGTGIWSGPFRGPRRGQGLDFDDLRPYTEGDDVRHIDWKVSARYNALHTRLYREEKDNVITLCLDLCSPMFTGSTELKATQAGKLAAALLWKATTAGSRVAIITLQDDGIQSIKATAGERGAIAGCAMISDQFSNAKLQVGKDTDAATIQPLIEHLLQAGRSVGGVILISGYDQSRPELQQSLNFLCARAHQARNVCAIHIVDPIEITGIGAGTYSYNDNKASKKITLTEKQSASLTKALQHQRTTLKNIFKNTNIPMFDTEQGLTPCIHNVLNLGWVA